VLGCGKSKISEKRVYRKELKRGQALTGKNGRGKYKE
jgi:hypothetical protein